MLFYMDILKQVMCQAFRSKMTQRQGFVWLLPGWYKDGWYDTDALTLKKSKVDSREARKRQRSDFKISCISSNLSQF